MLYFVCFLFIFGNDAEDGDDVGFGYDDANDEDVDVNVEDVRVCIYMCV